MPTEHIAFRYDPIQLTRLTLQVSIEKKYDTQDQEDSEFPKSLRYAIFEFMRTMTNAELEALLDEYVEEENVKQITLEEHDMERLEHYILKSKRLNDLRWSLVEGGTDGMGVLDLTRLTFTPCTLAQHGETLKGILKAHHGAYGDAYEKIMFGYRTEHAGIRAGELVNYVKNNFKFIEGSYPIDNYMTNATGKIRQN